MTRPRLWNCARALPIAMVTWLTLAVAGCTNLPVHGPNHHIVSYNATSSVTESRRHVVRDYVLLDINRIVLDNLVDVGPESFFRTFGAGRGLVPDLKVGVGDVLTVSIFEASSGGLFSRGEAGPRTAPFVTLPPQTVDHHGTITVPFAGPILVRGRTVREIQKTIETRLASRAIDPQVVVTLGEQSSSEIAVFGDAAGTYKSRLRPGGERVLDVIARAGMRAPGYETFVTLQRRGRRATVFFPRLVDSPVENIYVEPGDVLYVHREPQRFVALGALGNISQTQGLTGLLTFDAPRLSLAQAVAKAGGLLDTRADGRHVLLYRHEFRDVLERIGVDLAPFPPEQKYIPTIYRANYRDPSVFFVADQFPMRNRDIIYVSNADSIELEKFLFHTRAISSTIAGVATDITVTREAVRSLSR